MNYNFKFLSIFKIELNYVLAKIKNLQKCKWIYFKSENEKELKIKGDFIVKYKYG